MSAQNGCLHGLLALRVPCTFTHTASAQIQTQKYICGMSVPECALPVVLQRLLPLQALAQLGCLRQLPPAALGHLGQRPVINNKISPQAALLSAPTLTRAHPRQDGQFIRGSTEVVEVFQEADSADFFIPRLK